MRFSEYSHRHGKEILQIRHPEIYSEIQTILCDLEPFPHGAEKQKTGNPYVKNAFLSNGWVEEKEFNFNTEKKRDFVDLYKNNVAIEMEFSRFEMFFRDFFRFMLLYDMKEIEVGIILTLDNSAYKRWGNGVESYPSARASFTRLVNFLNGDYSSIVHVPIWCIGIE